MSQGWRVLTSGLALAFVASSCGAPLEGKLALALKYVTYRDPSGAAVVDEAAAKGNLAAVNTVWATCEIAFQLDEFKEVDPAAYGLKFSTRDLSELEAIRGAFSTRNEFLLVTTGPWDRSGTLGTSQANAWTAMPAVQGLFGAVMEEKVGDFAAMIAHELGHYLGLEHVNDSHDVMNPLIYSYSKSLSADQCKAARASVGAFWTSALRR